MGKVGDLMGKSGCFPKIFHKISISISAVIQSYPFQDKSRYPPNIQNWCTSSSPPGCLGSSGWGGGLRTRAITMLFVGDNQLRHMTVLCCTWLRLNVCMTSGAERSNPGEMNPNDLEIVHVLLGLCVVQTMQNTNILPTSSDLILIPSVKKIPFQQPYMATIGNLMWQKCLSRNRIPGKKNNKEILKKAWGLLQAFWGDAGQQFSRRSNPLPNW